MNRSRPRLAALIGASALARCSAAPGRRTSSPVPPLKARVTDLTGTLTARPGRRPRARARRVRGAQGQPDRGADGADDAARGHRAVRDPRRRRSGRSGARRSTTASILVVAKNDQQAAASRSATGSRARSPTSSRKRVIRETIAPHFRRGRLLRRASTAGTRAADASSIDGEKLPPPAPAARSSRGESAPTYKSLFVILLVVIVVVGGDPDAVLGRFFGSAATGGVVGFVALAIAGTLHRGRCARDSSRSSSR